MTLLALTTHLFSGEKISGRGGKFRFVPRQASKRLSVEASPSLEAIEPLDREKASVVQGDAEEW